MKIVTDGIVIREQTVRESDKVITVLTRDSGIITAYAAGAKNFKNPKSTASGLLTYSQFTFYRGKERFSVDEAHAKEVFMELRSDLEKLALAQYFCEVAGVLVHEEENSEEQLRLILNALYLLCKDKKPTDLIKAVFELRMMTICGFMPNLVYCQNCGVYEHEGMNFLPDEGILLCGDCVGMTKKRRIRTGFSTTAAMRHCIFAEFDKLFAFTVSDETLRTLSKVAEEYILYHLNRGFKTLEFYKTIKT